jgi:hypothetical protein
VKRAVLQAGNTLGQSRIGLPIFEMGLTAGVAGQQGNAHSSVAPDPTFTFTGGLCFPTLDFVIAFWIVLPFYTLLSSLFGIFLKSHDAIAVTR